MVIIAAEEKQFFAESGRDCRTFLFGLSYKQKNQIKSRKKTGIRGRGPGIRDRGSGGRTQGKWERAED